MQVNNLNRGRRIRNSTVVRLYFCHLSEGTLTPPRDTNGPQWLTGRPEAETSVLLGSHINRDCELFRRRSRGEETQTKGSTFSLDYYRERRSQPSGLFGTFVYDSRVGVSVRALPSYGINGKVFVVLLFVVPFLSLKSDPCHRVWVLGS